MPESATARIAAKLAARNNAKPEPEAQDDPAEEPTDEAIEDEAPAKKMTLKEKQAARRAERDADEAAVQGKITAEPDDDEDDDEEDETSTDDSTDDGTSNEDSQPTSGTQTSSGSAGTKRGSSKLKPSSSSQKKPASPAQIAAREAFAQRSREAAAAKKGETPIVKAKAVVSGKPTGKGQTPEQIKAKQNADRAAARKQAEETEAARPVRQPTSKPVKSKATKAQLAKANGAAPKVPRVSRDTKYKVHALLSKGKTRREIMETLGLSYPSVMHHAKSYEGEVASTRGSIFVKTPLDEEGNKLGRNKTEEVSRSEAMRRLYKSGVEVGDVARAFEVKYQIAYTAIKSLFGTSDDGE